MSVSARIEIAAAPEDVRRIFLDFPNWSKFGDPVLRSVSPVPSEDPSIMPAQKGSHVIVNFAGVMNADFVIIENTPELFCWYSNAFYLIEGTHSFRFLPSEKTLGHTTFVNEEVFGRLLWVMWKIGMDAQPGFEAFCRGVKARVESVVAEERIAM